MKNNGNQNSADDTIWIVVVCVVLLFGMLLAWNAYHNEVYQFLRIVKKGETFLFSFIDPAWHRLDTKLAEADPAAVPLEYVTAAYNTWSRWLWTPILLALAWACYSILTFRRLYTPQMLLEKQKDVFPPIKPFVKRDISRESENLGQWRLAETPLLFLIRNRLIYGPDYMPLDVSGAFECSEFSGFYENEKPVPRVTPTPLEENALRKTAQGNSFLVRTKYLANNDKEKFSSACLIPRENSAYLHQRNFLDEVALVKILREQAGKRIEGDPFEFLKGLADKNGACLYHLALAFYAAGYSDKAKQESWDSICAIDECFDNAIPWDKVVIDSPVSEIILAKYPPSQNEKFQNVILKKHANYVNSFLMALYYQARERGVFPDAWFNWLRYYDRTAWYALAQVGGRCAWIEGLGAWCQYNVELVLDDPLPVPYVSAGIRAIKSELMKEGWLLEE